MWTVCITSISHVLKLNGYGGPQAKVNEKNQGFKGWETLVTYNGVGYSNAAVISFRTDRTSFGSTTKYDDRYIRPFIKY